MRSHVCRDALCGSRVFGDPPGFAGRCYETTGGEDPRPSLCRFLGRFSPRRRRRVHPWVDPPRQPLSVPRGASVHAIILGKLNRHPAYRTSNISLSFHPASPSNYRHIPSDSRRRHRHILSRPDPYRHAHLRVFLLLLPSRSVSFIGRRCNIREVRSPRSRFRISE